jgi:outer membrane immunogenic protein
VVYGCPDATNAYQRNEGLVMKKTLVTSVVFGALMAGNAVAADMAVKAPIMKAPPMPTYNWTGCYLDAGGGYGMWNQDHWQTVSFGGVPNGATTENTGGGRGWLGRFGGGCDYQLSGTFSNFVIGAFGDYDVMDLNGSMVPLTVFPVGASSFPVSAQEKESSAWAAGARIGYLIAPTILTYVDGGWTATHFGQMNTVTNQGFATGNAYPSHTYNGWFVGSGFEYQFTWLPIQGLFLRSEYRYSTYQSADLMQFNVATGAPAGNAGLGDIMHAKKQVQTVTTSLVWRFNWFH